MSFWTINAVLGAALTCPVCYHYTDVHRSILDLIFSQSTVWIRKAWVFMPKIKTKKNGKNGITANQDSVYLTPTEEDGLNHRTGTPNGQAFFSQNSHEYYTSPHSPMEQDDPESGCEKRGVGLDFAILDSTFLLSQVIPTLFMGMIVQFAQTVTAYIACSAIFGAVAIYLACHIVFDQNDLLRS